MQKMMGSVVLAMVMVLSLNVMAEDESVVTSPSATDVTPIITEPEIAAKSYFLIDHTSGRVLAEKNAEQRLPPASITKLMTAYVVSKELAAERITLADEVLISEKAWRMVGSRSFIEVNTKVPVEALLRGMIIQSGNDAAVALAEHIAGSEESFAGMMNEYAAKLEMVNTQYRNATGLPDEGHYTTAKDIAILSSAIIEEFPVHYKWYAEKEYTYNKITQHNRNKLLWRDSSVDGLKTGHTDEAGYCLVASAKRGDMRLISVVLGTRSEEARAQETQKLFGFGFRFFETHMLYKPHEKLVDVRVWKGAEKKLTVGLTDGLAVTVPRGQYKKLVVTTHIQTPVVAPVITGESVGHVEIKLGDVLISQHPIAALKTVDAGSWWRKLWDHLWMMIFG